MKLSIKEKKQFEKWLEVLLKMIPIFLAIFLIGNVIFNISYFFSLRTDWSSLLTLSDYYEGSILYVKYALLIFLLSCGIYLFQRKGLSYIKNSILYVWKIIVLIFSALVIALLYLPIGIIRIIMIKKGKPSFSFKRQYIAVLKNMKSARELVIKQFLFQITGFIAIVSLVSFLLVLLLIIIYTLYLYNWFSLFIAAGIYINLLLLINRKPSLWKIIFVCVTVYWYTMWAIGGFSARPTPGHNFPFLNFISSSQTTYVTTAQQQNFILVRAINKGVIVRDNDELYFFKWEDVKYLHKQKAEK